jgi:hypothetical protein
MQDIETGNFAIPRWVFCPPDSIRLVNWNIDRGLQLSRIVKFLSSAKPDLILLQEADLNARRTHHVNVADHVGTCLALRARAHVSRSSSITTVFAANPVQCGRCR